MIKSATIYKIASTPAIEKLQPFVPTTATQEKSAGWIPPNEGGLFETISGATVLCIKVETRTVPAATLDAAVKAKCEQIERLTGRKPGKKERKDIKDECKQALLPRAFPKQKTVLCILDGDTLIIDATGSIVDDVLTALVSADGMFQCFEDAPQAWMKSLLFGAESESFTVGGDCELADEDAKVKYTNHPLLIDEIEDHLRQGKMPVNLALHAEGVVFTLTEKLEFKKISFDSESTEFESDMTVAILTMRQVIADLLIELKGDE